MTASVNSGTASARTSLTEPVVKFARLHRIAWSSGGNWERLFALVVPLFVAYVAAMWMLISLLGFSFYSWASFTWVAASFVLLLPVWINSMVTNAKVIRAVVAGGVLSRDAQSDALANYLSDYGEHGRWLRGDHVGLTYLVFYLGWGIVAAMLPRISPWDGLTVFVLIAGTHGLIVVTLLWWYRRILRSFQDGALQKGYPVRAQA